MAMTEMTTERVEKAIRGRAPIHWNGCVFCDALKAAEYTLSLHDALPIYRKSVV